MCQRTLVRVGVAAAALLVGAPAMPSVAQSPIPPETSTAPASPAQFRLKEERDRLALRATDQLVYVEGVFFRATPGWPAQFRAHEEADALREQIRSAGPG